MNAKNLFNRAWQSLPVRYIRTAFLDLSISFGCLLALFIDGTASPLFALALVLMFVAVYLYGYIRFRDEKAAYALSPVSNPLKGLTEGRIVHFVMANGQHRPAIVVRNWAREFAPPCPGYINLQVFTDGRNDTFDWEGGKYSDEEKQEIASGKYWVTSVCYSESKEPRTWHWIEPA